MLGKKTFENDVMFTYNSTWLKAVLIANLIMKFEKSLCLSYLHGFPLRKLEFEAFHLFSRTLKN